MVYIYIVEYYSAIKKNDIVPFATTWIDLEIITLSKISKKEKDKISQRYHSCGINNITQMNMSTRQKQTHRYRE